MTQLVPAAAFERGARLIDLPPDTETSPEADQAAGTEPRRRRRPHMVVLALGGAGIVVHQLLPARWHELSYDSIEIYILLAMIWGIRRHRPRPGRPWWLLTAGTAATGRRSSTPSW
jgi:hypothetical protein